jgi:hypothetical protein
MSTAASSRDLGRGPTSAASAALLAHRDVGPVLGAVAAARKPVQFFRVSTMPYPYAPIRMNVFYRDPLPGGLTDATAVYETMVNQRGEGIEDVHMWVIEAGWALGSSQVHRQVHAPGSGPSFMKAVDSIWLVPPGSCFTGDPEYRLIPKLQKYGFTVWTLEPLALQRSINPARWEQRRIADISVDEHGLRLGPVPDIQTPGKSQPVATILLRPGPSASAGFPDLRRDGA